MTGFLLKRPHSPTPMRASRLWTWYPAVIMDILIVAIVLWVFLGTVFILGGMG